jgi:hypothetical protein
LTAAFENVDFVFPVVRVKWRMAFGFDLKEPHGKIRRAVILFD